MKSVVQIAVVFHEAANRSLVYQDILFKAEVERVLTIADFDSQEALEKAATDLEAVAKRLGKSKLSVEITWR